jgi:hypothetical protein
MLYPRNQEYSRTCTECDETLSLREFTNYKEPSIIARQPRCFYDNVCRTCRIETSAVPVIHRECVRCEKSRKEDAFIRVPRVAVPQDQWCRTCRRDIERQWSKGRWLVEGYTNMPRLHRQSRSHVRCNACRTVIVRRDIASHDRMCDEK